MGKDASEPIVSTEADGSTPCCYTMMLDPLPGQGFPINNVASGCHEPNHEDQAGLYGGGRTAADRDMLQQPRLPSGSFSSSFHYSCDKLSKPSERLNVTSSEVV